MVSDLNIYVWKWSKIEEEKTKQKNGWFFLTKHGGNHASCWIRRPLVEECITNYGIFLDVFEILRFEFLHFE